MTIGDVSGNMSALTLGAVTVGTTITMEQYTLLLPLAQQQVAIDDPGFSDEQATEAAALLMLHMIDRAKGQSGVTSQSEGDCSVSRKLSSGLTPWMDEYQALVARIKATPVLLDSLTDGLAHEDATFYGLKLDQSTIVTPYDTEDLR